MKNLRILFLFLFTITLSSAQTSNRLPGCSPRTKQYLQLYRADMTDTQLPEGYAYRRHADGIVYIGAMVQVRDVKQANEDLRRIGAQVGTRAGDVWTLQLKPSEVNSLVNSSSLVYVQLDEPVFPTLDIARSRTRVDSVQAGIGLPMRYSGKDVLIGVIDFGFDYNHPTFYDTTHSAYRIRKVWELDGIGTPPAGFTYGNEITDTALIRAQGTDNAIQTHGTATAGLAGGSGFGSNPNNSRFRGMAYESEFILVGVRRDTIAQQWLQGSFDDFIDGINYIFTQATAIGKPCVVNISWGSQSGPHDGTTLFNRACANMSGPGKIIVMSAGNEGTERIHLTKTFTASDTLMKTFVVFNNQLYNRTWVDAWGDTAKTFCGQVELYRNGTFVSSTGFQCIDDLTHDTILIGSNGTDTCFVQFLTNSAEFNQKPRMTIDLYNKSTDSVVVSFKANEGTVDMWDEYYYFGYKYSYSSAFDSLGKSWALRGDANSTVSDMGASDSVLLVGAYASKVSFTDMNGQNWSYSGYVLPQRLVPFSSRGPMADGRIKPDFTAPGLTIATSISSYDTAYTPTGSNSSLTISAYNDPVLTKNFYYAEFTGTSASAPIASGIVALMLQVYPSLTVTQAKNIIRTTCINDQYTGVIPMAGNNSWGRGKINAYGAIKMLLQQTGLYHTAGEPVDCVLFPNPSKGDVILEVVADRNEMYTVEVVDVTGRTVLTQNMSVQSGRNEMHLGLSAFGKGLYLVQVKSPRGATNIRSVVE